MSHTIGGCHHPIVFNNACSSWRALASRFSYGGASVYVGTTTEILGTSVGAATADKFVRDITLRHAAGAALHRTQKNLTTEFGYTPYLMSGYLYTRLDKPPVRQRESRAALQILDAIKAVQREPPSQARSGILKFLKDELHELANMEVKS